MFRELILSGLGLIIAATLQTSEPENHGADGYNDNEEYCEEIYWEDYDKCIDWRNPDLILTEELCESIIFKSTRRICFKKLAEERMKKKKWKRKMERRNGGEK